MSNSKSLLSDQSYLEHILVEAGRISQIMAGKSIAHLETDWELEHTVTRSLEIMGEAAGRVSKDCRELFPEIPWYEMKSVRNRMIHAYFDIDYRVVFNIVSKDLNGLQDKLSSILTDPKFKGLTQFSEKAKQLDRPLLEKTNPNKSVKRRKL